MSVTELPRAQFRPCTVGTALALALLLVVPGTPTEPRQAERPAPEKPAAQAQPAARTRIAFGGPELFKLDWGAPVLAVGDVNGDGLLDLVSFNPDEASIECFLQKRASTGSARPELVEGRPGAPTADTAARPKGSDEDINLLPDDARFERVPLAVEQHVFSLACADFTGDGRDDLCYYGEPNKLIIREQGPQGTWAPPGGGRTDFDLPEASRNPGALAAGDFDGDGRTDIALVGRNVLYLITHEKDGEGPAALKKLPASAEGSSFILSGDFDGDGRLDLAYSTTQAEAPLCFRLQAGAGGVGPEQFAEVPRFRAAAPVSAKQERRSALAFILATSGRLELRRLTSPDEAQVPLERAGPLIYPLEEDKAERRFAVCDLDGDGRLEVVTTYPSTAQVGVMFQAAGGIGSALLSPSFSGISDLAAGDLDGDGRAEVVVLSKGEDSLGYSRWLSEEPGPGRLDFPRPIPVTGHPLAVALADLNGDGRQEVLYARKQEKTYSVSWRGLGKAGDFSEERSVELAGLDSDVSGLVACDLNGDGHVDVLALVGFGPARLLLGDGEGQFRDTSLDPALVLTLFRGLTLGGVTLGDASGDGREELLVANKNFARVLTVSADGTPSVLEQASGKSARSVVVSAAVGSLSGEGRPEVVLLDSWAKEVTVLGRLADGTLGDPHSIALRGLPLVNARVYVNDFTGDAKADILILTQGGLALIPLGRAKPEFELLAGYESDAERAGMGDVVAGDLFGDGENELLVLDVTNHSLELLRWQEANLRRLYRFTVFEKKVFRGREQNDAEPRQAVIADLTGDGLADIALLVHDRIALYPQVAPEASAQQPPPLQEQPPTPAEEPSAPQEPEAEPAEPSEQEGEAP